MAKRTSNHGEEWDETSSDSEAEALNTTTEHLHPTFCSQATGELIMVVAKITQPLLPEAGTRPSQYLASQSETFAMVTKAGLMKRQHTRSEKKKQKKQQEKVYHSFPL